MEEIEATAAIAPSEASTQAAAVEHDASAQSDAAQGDVAQGDAAHTDPAPVATNEASAPAPGEARTVMGEINAYLHHLDLLPATTAAWFRTKLKELESKL